MPHSNNFYSNKVFSIIMVKKDINNQEIFNGDYVKIYIFNMNYYV